MPRIRRGETEKSILLPPSRLPPRSQPDRKTDPPLVLTGKSMAVEIADKEWEFQIQPLQANELSGNARPHFRQGHRILFAV